MKKDEYYSRKHIEKKQSEINGLNNTWKLIEKLNETTGISEKTMDELKEKISSRIVQCKKSIDSHVRLLPDAPY